MKKIKFTQLKAIPLLLTFNILLLTCFAVFSQGGVAINTTGAAADSSAILDLSSNSHGFLIPRLTTNERDNNIINPATGLQIFNITTNCLEIYISSIWQSIYCGCAPPLTPIAGTHTPAQTEITWNWNSVQGATGYKYHTANDYANATDNGTNTTYTQSTLTCNTPYSLYVWAYNNCGESDELVLNQTTSNCIPNCGLINDSRDGQTYQTVQIGTQCWMRENLKYLPSVVGPSTGSTTIPYYYVIGYNGTDVNAAKLEANFSTYGALYNWVAATTACPSGWHLPSDAEWQQLEVNVGMDPLVANTIGWRGTNEGTKLKSTSGWNSGNGTDDFYFTVLPSGRRYPPSSFTGTGVCADLWTSTIYDSANSLRRFFHMSDSNIFNGQSNKAEGNSVRCIKN